MVRRTMLGGIIHDDYREAACAPISAYHGAAGPPRDGRLVAPLGDEILEHLDVGSDFRGRLVGEPVCFARKILFEGTNPLLEMVGLLPEMGAEVVGWICHGASLPHTGWWLSTAGTPHCTSGGRSCIPNHYPHLVPPEAERYSTTRRMAGNVGAVAAPMVTASLEHVGEKRLPCHRLAWARNCG